MLCCRKKKIEDLESKDSDDKDDKDKDDDDIRARRVFHETAGKIIVNSSQYMPWPRAGPAHMYLLPAGWPACPHFGCEPLAACSCEARASRIFLAAAPAFSNSSIEHARMPMIECRNDRAVARARAAAAGAHARRVIAVIREHSKSSFEVRQSTPDAICLLSHISISDFRSLF